MANGFVYFSEPELMFEMERHGLDIGGHPVFLKEISGSKTDYIYSQNHK